MQETFNERLKELLEERGINAFTLSKELNITSSAMSRYINGQLPEIKYLVLIADYFNVSCDFLLGRADDSTHKFSECPPFSQRLNFLLKDLKISGGEFYKIAELPRSSFYKWKAGTAVPMLFQIIKIADAFSCSVDYVLGRE